MAQGFLAIGIVAAWHLANSWGSYKSPLVHRITGSEPTVLVEHGQIKRDGMAVERVNEEELWAELRLQGVEDLAEVKTATLEPNGMVSVINEDWAEPIQKRNLADLKRRAA